MKEDQKDEIKYSMHIGASPPIFTIANGLRNDLTQAEIILWEQLKLRKLNGLKFRRQHPILRYVLDFYCHKYKLAIELDGEIHIEVKQKSYDEMRDSHLKEFGIHLLRFKNSDIYFNIEKVKARILEESELIKRNH